MRHLRVKELRCWGICCNWSTANGLGILTGDEHLQVQTKTKMIHDIYSMWTWTVAVALPATLLSRYKDLCANTLSHGPALAEHTGREISNLYPDIMHLMTVCWEIHSSPLKKHTLKKLDNPLRLQPNRASIPLSLLSVHWRDPFPLR